VEGVTVLAVMTPNRIFDDITFEELIFPNVTGRDKTVEIEVDAGLMKPGFQMRGFKVTRVIFKVISDLNELDRKLHTRGFAYVETPDNRLVRRNFDQVGK